MRGVGGKERFSGVEVDIAMKALEKDAWSWGQCRGRHDSLFFVLVSSFQVPMFSFDSKVHLFEVSKFQRYSKSWIEKLQ